MAFDGPAEFAEFARVVRLDDPGGLDAVRELVGNARVVALGEGAHNITEFHGFRDLLFRFLVRDLGFSALVMESGFAEGLAVDAWVHGGPGQVRAIARDGITYRFGECEPVRRQLRWMRRWNAEQAESAEQEGRSGTGKARISFYGMDLPGSSTSPGPAVRACLDRIPGRPGDGELLRLSDLGGRTEAAIRYAAMPTGDQARLFAGLRELVERAFSLGDEVVRRCAASLRAFVQELEEPYPSPGEPYPRDAFMAETVQWILGRERRVLVSAHNAHVRRSPLQGRLMAGGLLAPALGADLVAIGMTYGSGPEVGFTQRSPRPFDCEVSLGARSLAPHSVEARIEVLLEEQTGKRTGKRAEEQAGAGSGHGGRSAVVVDLHRVPVGFFTGVEGTLAGGGGLDAVDDFPAAYDALIHFRRVTRVPGAFERLRAEFAAASGPGAAGDSQSPGDGAPVVCGGSERRAETRKTEARRGQEFEKLKESQSP